MQAKYDLIDTTKYLDMLRQKITTMKGMKDALPFTEMSANVLDKYKNQYMNVYNKGALIGMCLDIKLRQLSGGKYGTQNLMQDLSKTYGKEQSFKDDELFDKISSLTFPEIRQFFATYVEGKDPLPLTDILQSVGIDYLPDATVKQASLGGISIGFNQKTNRLKVTSIDKVNDFGKQMGYKADDELVSVNGEAMEMMKIQTIMGEFGSKTKEGEIVTVEVVRKNAEGKEENVKLSAPANLVEVKQKNVLKLVENPTAEQLKLRKDWLKP
jgi:predicted metalloprotease with PDZ domain